MSSPVSIHFYGHPLFDVKTAEESLKVGFSNLSQLEGEFAVVRQSNAESSLFCSGNGVTQLFYAIHNGRLFYGDTVSGVLESASLGWHWNYEALANLAIFGHLLGSETLHPAVRRVGKNELVFWNGSSLESTLCNVDTPELGDPADEAIESVLESVRQLSAPTDVISFSAGFDSRVILAAFLALGLKPNLVVMGNESCTDVSIAFQIARDLNLSIERIPLTGNKAIADRSLISRITSGTKTIENWHTYEYAASASALPGSGVWIGSNGEYARTFFVDRGLAFYGANALGKFGVSKFWHTKISRNSLPPELHYALNQELVESIEPHTVLERLNAYFPHSSLAAVNDELYLERVRQFIANGLRLVSTKYLPKTPFLNPRWISAVKRMPRHWKMGNKWHRYAISRLCPRLLSFPYDAGGVPMLNSPGLGYWLGLSPHSKNVPYFDYPVFLKSDTFVTAYTSSLKTLKGIFRQDDLDALSHNWPMRTTTYFAALSFYTEMLQQRASEG
ncbi:MAG: hypothetical protein JST28_20615 [Acidobacteria bacterium]|nr:hypothetical protein [Acidobacteriota bacterium]